MYDFVCFSSQLLILNTKKEAIFLTWKKVDQRGSALVDFVQTIRQAISQSGDNQNKQKLWQSWVFSAFENIEPFFFALPKTVIMLFNSKSLPGVKLQAL